MRHGCVRAALLSVCICGIPSGVSARQAPNIDVGLGYGQLRAAGFVQHGFTAQVHLPFTDSLGLEAYVSRYWNPGLEAFGVNTLGARVSFRDVHPRVVPYAAAGIDVFDLEVQTFGAGTTRDTGVSALRFGGGSDVEVTRAIAVRFDARYTPLHLSQEPGREHQWRAGMDFSVGLAFELPWSVR